MATTGAKTFQNYIDGEWVDAASGETFEHTSMVGAPRMVYVQGHFVY
mgnify:CR=1 FL=1